MAGVILERCTVLFLFLLFYLQVIPTRSEATYFYHICANNTAAPNSKYRANINTLFHSLSSSFATSTNQSFGFYATSAGNGTSDVVYGLYLCRGDQSAASCQDCVSTATTTDLPKKYCSNRREAVIWYDECMVRYSDISLLHKMNTDPEITGTNTRTINGNQTRFIELTGELLNDVSVRAAGSDRLGRKYATVRGVYTSSETVYTLAQCTPDLSSSDCQRCLRAAMGQISNFNGQGARCLQPSCNIRYEIYPFFNNADNSTLFHPSMPPSSPSTNNSTTTGTGKKKVSAKLISAIIVPVLALLFAAVIAILICSIRRKNKHDPIATQDVGEDFTKVAFLQYDLATLQSATNNFSSENKLGEGGFGSVYKGVLLDGQEIAVKRLSSSSSQGVLEFKNEVLLVAKLQHRNLARLLGFCLEGWEKLLVYEYVPNKSLDRFLFDPEKQGLLDWGMRYKIILGIARGMLYLHQDSRLKIIHRDLKTSNILLDMDMNPKISDFGMARLVGVDQTQGNTSRVVGTYGYMSPEYALHGQFSERSDVYSFGVLILEIISGQKNTNFDMSEYVDLLSYAWKLWKDGRQIEFVDPAIKETCSSHEVLRCMHLGLLCVEEHVDDRPSMATSVLVLESQSTTLSIPKEPTFFMKSNRTESSMMKEVESDQSTNQWATLSVNDVSISEMEPR